LTAAFGRWRALLRTSDAHCVRETARLSERRGHVLSFQASNALSSTQKRHGVLAMHATHTRQQSTNKAGFSDVQSLGRSEMTKRERAPAAAGTCTGRSSGARQSAKVDSQATQEMRSRKQQPRAKSDKVQSVARSQKRITTKSPKNRKWQNTKTRTSLQRHFQLPFTGGS
jgi:hypothetical protein